MLLASAGLLAIAPAFMPEAYSSIEHTTSQSAAQGVSGAWVAKLGFVLFGFAVLWLATQERHGWPRLARFLLGAFGVLMVTTAVFSSHAPFLSDDFDTTEDLLHSLAATGMGFAFAFGVLARGMRRARERGKPDLFDVIAVLAAVLIPLGMSGASEIQGVLQRTMFFIAYVWFAREALELVPHPTREPVHA
jgi:drug/metabolite transporter (DMT)-like permease